MKLKIKTDLYTLEDNSFKNMTIEHIIPCFYLNKIQKVCPYNIGITNVAINNARGHYGFESRDQNTLIQFEHHRKKMILSSKHSNLGLISRATAYMLYICEDINQQETILNNVLSFSNIKKWNQICPVSKEELRIHNLIIKFGYTPNPFITGQKSIEDCLNLIRN
jgi:endonuclease I